MADTTVAQVQDATMKATITKIDAVVQDAQNEGEALLGGIHALITKAGGSHAENLRNAVVLIERLDIVLLDLMNEVNCMAERHGANFIAEEVQHV